MDTRPLPSWAAALLLLAVATGLRAADFGSPIIHVDEQYFLLVGQQLRDGAIPYLDIWDRRPVGLFLVYAAAAILPGDDIVGYQLLAALFAGLTAILVASGARAIGASRSGAFAAGVAYLIWLSLLGGRGGQAAVFGNVLIAAAARLTLRVPTLTVARPSWPIVANGVAVSLLAGLAVQITMVAGVAAAFLAATHLWWLRRNGARYPVAAAAAVAWIAIAVAPTAAAALGFRALGPDAYDAWATATLSSMPTLPHPTSDGAIRLLGIIAQLSPLLLCAGIAWRRRNVRLPAERRIVFGWLVAATAGLALGGMIFDRFALPLVAPLAMAAGLALGRIPRVLVGTLVLGFLLLVVERAFIGRDAAGARAVADVVAANSRGGCPYVFSGDSATYVLTHACLPTRYAFPDGLSQGTDAAGIDPAMEIRRILSTRPPVIVVGTRNVAAWTPAATAAIVPVLKRDYRMIFAVPRARRQTVVFLRNDLPVIRR